MTGEKGIYAEASGAGKITRLASTVRREIFRETRPFGMTPFEAARSKTEMASLSVLLTVSASLAAIAEVTFLSAVFTAEFTERFLSRLFWDCRSLLSADG